MMKSAAFLWDGWMGMKLHETRINILTPNWKFHTLKKKDKKVVTQFDDEDLTYIHVLILMLEVLHIM